MDDDLAELSGAALEFLLVLLLLALADQLQVTSSGAQHLLSFGDHAGGELLLDLVGLGLVLLDLGDARLLGSLAALGPVESRVGLGDFAARALSHGWLVWFEWDCV